MPVDADVLAGIGLFYLLPTVRFSSRMMPILKFRLSKLLRTIERELVRNGYSELM